MSMRHMLISLSTLLLVPISAVTLAQTAAFVDTDTDGLSDFLETHKYLTDPTKPDSDGDGVPDGDWLERREYAYTVRSVIQVMRPVTPEFLNDAYQDARVLDETETYVELEVIHYPLVDLKNVGTDGATEDVARWLEPGPTSNASPRLARKIRSAMKKDVGSVLDVTLGESLAQAAKWLLNRAKHQDRFSTFITGVDANGKFFVPKELAAYTKNKSKEEGLSPEETWPREIQAAGMFQHSERGSCSSSAIYLSGCLRALGVPTRTVLCVPIIDANDEREWDLLRQGIQHNQVRAQIEGALEKSRRGWSSHTFNEVYVEGRWHRLNYSDLDAGVLSDGFFGLMTHVATFHDWADARMWETIGPRGALSNDEKSRDVFGSHNPYSTIALRDSFGVHCSVQNPPAKVATVAVNAIHWTDSENLPQDILASNGERGRMGLIAEVPWSSMDAISGHLSRADNKVMLTSEDVPSVQGNFHTGCIWGKSSRGFLFIQLNKQDWKSLVKGATYRVSTEVQSDVPSWILNASITR